jgi:prevent-host-death family protein
MMSRRARGNYFGDWREDTKSPPDRRGRGGIMKTASVAKIKAQLNEYLKASDEGPVVVTQNGKPIAVLLRVHGEEELERLMLAHSPKFQAVLTESRRQIRAGETISHDELWRSVEEGKTAKRSSSSKPQSKKR